MAWIIRRRKRDLQGITQHLYYKGMGAYIQPIPAEKSWHGDPLMARKFDSQEEGRDFCTESGLTFNYGAKNVDVVQYIGGPA